MLPHSCAAPFGFSNTPPQRSQTSTVFAADGSGLGIARDDDSLDDAFDERQTLAPCKRAAPTDSCTLQDRDDGRGTARAREL
jgi:hypothetical protein